MRVQFAVAATALLAVIGVPGQCPVEIVTGIATNSSTYGKSVALWDNIAVVGASDASVGVVPDAGAAYVYVRNPVTATWTPDGVLTSPFPTKWDNFGASVAIHKGVIVVGEPHAQGGRGRAWVFEKDSVTNSWNRFRRMPESRRSARQLSGFARADWSRSSRSERGG